MKYTPGPWEVRQEPNRGKQYISYSGSNWRIAVITMQEAKYHNSNKIIKLPTIEAKANARLIAAAPDLLEACKGLLQYFWDNDLVGFDHEAAICNCSTRDITGNASIAIAKAGGIRV